MVLSQIEETFYLTLEPLKKWKSACQTMIGGCCMKNDKVTIRLGSMGKWFNLGILAGRPRWCLFISQKTAGEINPGYGKTSDRSQSTHLHYQKHVKNSSRDQFHILYRSITRLQILFRPSITHAFNGIHRNRLQPGVNKKKLRPGHRPDSQPPGNFYNHAITLLWNGTRWPKKTGMVY